MPWYSLLSVHTTAGPRVSGNWVQDHFGTLETAAAWARHTEQVNSNAITVAVVDQVPGPVAILSYWEDRERLD